MGRRLFVEYPVWSKKVISMASEIITKPVIRLRPGEQRALLFFGDLLMATLAVLVGVYLWSIGDQWINFSLDFFRLRVPWWFYGIPLAWMLMLLDIYELHRAANWRRTVRAISLAAIVGMIIYALIYFTSNPGELNRRGVAGFLVAAYLLTLSWRWVYIRLYTNPSFLRRFLIVGAGENGKTMVQIYRMINPPPFKLLGFIDDDEQKIHTEIEGLRVLTSSKQLLTLADQLNVTDIIVAITGEMRGETFQTLLDAQERGIEITRMPIMYEELLGRVPIHHLESDWVIRSFVDEARSGGFYELGKRTLDLIGGIVGTLIFITILPFISLATLIDSGWPIFYSQERLGRGGKPYMMIKFRTMTQDAEKDGQAQMAGQNDPRITRVGNFLRATRLDEFPQFINVLRGEMSIVGPRAERDSWVATFQKEIPFYRARLLVKPGITGWAQVNYGYASTVEDTGVKLEYDLYYIKHRSILMDLLIILRTFSTVISRKGR
jgi:exopolysaccharide biosynthesis polyprenyl glycosylphosphotransferase